MPINEVVATALRQAHAQAVEAAAAVVRSVDHQRAVDRHAPLVGHARNEPRGLRIARVRGHGEAEARQRHAGELLPRRRIVRRTPDAVVMLDPEHVGRGRTANHTMRVLHVRVVGLLGRHVRGLHAPGLRRPRRAIVAGDPDAAATDAHQQLAGASRMRADRVDARHVVAATEPLAAAGLVPQRLVQLPARTAVVGAEQAAGQGAGPDHAGLLFQ